MTALLFLGALLWFKVDASKELSLQRAAVSVPVPAQ
jgi:hypothetical protein